MDPLEEITTWLVARNADMRVTRYAAHDGPPVRPEDVWVVELTRWAKLKLDGAAGTLLEAFRDAAAKETERW